MNTKEKRKGKFTGKIGNKLFLTFILLSVVPILVLGLGSYNKSYDLFEQKFKTDSMQNIEAVNISIDNYFQGMQRQVSMLSKNINVTDIEEKQEYAPFLCNLLKEVKESNEDAISLYMGTASKKMYSYPKQDNGKDYDPTTRPWYEKAVQNKGKVAISDVYVDPAIKKTMVSISKAVEKDGKLVGVVAMDLDLEKFSDDLSNIKVGDNGYLYIADKKGVIIAHKDKDKIGKDELGKQEYWNKISQNNTGFEEINVDNKKVYNTFSTNGLAQWKVVASVDKSELLKDTNVIKLLTFVFVIVCSLISVIVSIWFSKGISNNVKNLKNAFAKVSQGDFSEYIHTKSKDEFKELADNFNIMQDNVSALIKNVEVSSKEVLESSSVLEEMSKQTAVAVEQVSLTVEEISKGTVEQAKNSEIGVNNINSLAEKIDSISSTTGEISTISSQANELSHRGLDMIVEINKKSEGTKSATYEVGKITSEVDSSTKKIGIIIGTITEITEQTNLLALNAAIEAARAGEAGKGFSVVAEEIRKLAEKSRESAKEIENILSEIQSKSGLAVKSVESTEKIVISQQEAVHKAEEIFDKILSSVELLNNKIKVIVSSINVVDDYKKNVVEEITNISAVSEETAASTEEVSASTQEINANTDSYMNYASKLKELAEKLKYEIEKFKLK